VLGSRCHAIGDLNCRFSVYGDATAADLACEHVVSFTVPESARDHGQVGPGLNHHRRLGSTLLSGLQMMGLSFLAAAMTVFLRGRPAQDGSVACPAP